MARKKIDWIVYLEEIREYEIKVPATTIGGAEKEAKKIMKNGPVPKAKNISCDIMDVQEAEAEEEED